MSGICFKMIWGRRWEMVGMALRLVVVAAEGWYIKNCYNTYIQIYLKFLFV
jgi:hypothetical protein